MARESQTARGTAGSVPNMTSMSTDDAAQLAQMRRALLEQQVRAPGSRPATRPAAVTSRTASGPLPLSASQSQLWYLSQLAPDSRAFNEVIEIRKTGALNVDALRRALSAVVARHEALRTTFDSVDGVPHQIVREPTEVALPVSDLSDVRPQDAVARAVDIVAADSLPAYDLADGPLIRPRLIRITEEDHRLYLGLHHLIWDGTTLKRIVFPELVALYRRYAVGLPSSLPDPEAQYADYTNWQLEWLRQPEIAARITRWRGRLAGVAPTQLPLDYPRPPRQRFVGGTIPLTIDHTTVEGLRRAAQAAGGTLFRVLAAAYAWWLHLYTESSDVVFGTPHNLRQGSDLSAVVGYCVSPVVVRCHVSGQESFTELVGRMGHVVTDALNDVVPFETLVAALGVSRDPCSNPLFQTALAFQPALTSPADDWSLNLVESDVSDAVGSSKFDISIELDERPEGHVAGRLFFNADLFDRETAREMALHWCRLLDAVAAAPEIPMADHDLVTPDERGRQLSRNLSTQHGVPSEAQCVHEVISSQVERAPDAAAVQIGNTTLTYRQLDDRAAAIASRLVQAGAGPGTVVAVLLDRTLDLVAAVLGILKSGAAVLPLDPRQPTARNTFCINDAGANIVLTDHQLSTGGEAVRATVVNLDDSWRHAPRQVAPLIGLPTDLAYVIYTSGSTGRPKGVLIEHRSMTNLMQTMFREFGVAASDTVLSVSSISFDVALGDIFCALSCGARLVLATAAEATNPAALIRLIADSRATYMMATPTTFGALVAAGWHGNRRLTAASIGETLTDGLAGALLQRCGAVWNTYGPTETTVITSVARLAEGDTVTVGRPLPNVRMYVTDPRGRLQPVGVPGEIVIGGVAVGRGYRNRPDEHARRYGDDPFHAGGRIYRTGDRGRFLPDGRIQHLGRCDDQLKIRGFRIEPGEIESTLCEHPDVGCCAVVAREAPNGEQQLVAYVVGEPGCPSDAQVRDWLRRRLPEYMVPSAFVHLGALPMTASGKLDKAALPAPSPRNPGRSAVQPPRNETERRVARLWADLLAKPVTDVDSDFFDLGGHSLLAARLIARAQGEFGVALSLATFLDSGRTVAELAAITDKTCCGTDEITSEPPLHFIFPFQATAMSLRHFKARWGAAQPVHALIPEQPGGQFDLSVSVEQHASQILAAIRNRQPDGPLALVGYSFGGLLAYEVARQAVDAGQVVDWLCLLDADSPLIAPRVRSRQTLGWRLRQLRQRPMRERLVKFAEIALRVLRNGALRDPNGFDLGGAAKIACRYRQPGHAVPLEVFISEGFAADMEADLLGWDKTHRGTLSVHRLPGDHFTMLQLPLVEQLAHSMLESLRKAKASRRV
jgi:amino acid adenylation domain-containing protein